MVGVGVLQKWLWWYTRRRKKRNMRVKEVPSNCVPLLSYLPIGPSQAPERASRTGW